MERSFVVTRISRNWTRGRRGYLLSGDIEITTPDHDPTIMVIQVEAHLSEPLTGETAYDGDLLLNLLADRLQRPLPSRS